jgi:hypothetical protein
VTSDDGFRGTDSPDALTDARMLLQMLGHDPDTHRLVPVRRVAAEGQRRGQWDGIQVTDLDGNPVRFYTERSLRRRDREAQRGFQGIERGVYDGPPIDTAPGTLTPEGLLAAFSGSI